MNTNPINFSDYDGQSAAELNEMKFLDFENTTNSLNNLSSNNIDKLNSNKSFDEISYEKKYGVNNLTEGFYTGNIDVPELLKDLGDNKAYGQMFFYYQKYTDNLPQYTLNEINNQQFPFNFNKNNINEISNQLSPIKLKKNFINEYNSFYNDFKYETSVPLIYPNFENLKMVTAELNIVLNTKASEISLDHKGFSVNIDYSNKTINCHLEVIYKDSLDKRKMGENKMYTIDPIYVAISINCSNTNDFVAVLKETGSESILNHFKNDYVDLLNKCTNPDDLAVLYSFIPYDCNSLISEELLYKHIALLTKADVDGLTSPLNDYSDVLLKIFKILITIPNALERLIKNNAYIKRIYNNLNGDSETTEGIISNKILFASILSSYCILKNKSAEEIKFFFYGKGFKLETNITFMSLEKDDEIYIRQEIETPVYLPGQFMPFDIDLDEGYMYKPTDLVSFTNLNDENSKPSVVTALLVKAIADEAEWAEVSRAIRIGFDALGVIGGIAVLENTGNPVWFDLALADIVIASSDIIINGIAYKTLIETPQGKEFLDAWEEVYRVGGIVMATVNFPQLVQGLYTATSRFIKYAVSVKNYNYLNFARSVLFKAYLDVNGYNFTGNTVKLLVTDIELVTATGGVINQIKAEKLLNNGIVVASKQVQKANKTEEEIALIYKGEAIINTTKKDFFKATRQIIKNLHNEKKVLDICEELYRLTPKIEGKFWTWENFMGTKMYKAYNNEKSILNNIKVAKAKNQPSIKGSDYRKLFEAEVGEEMFNLGQIHKDKAIDFANKVNKGNTGEIDYSSYKYIVEAKTNLDSLDALKDLQTQLKRYLHKFAETEPNYLNAQNKTVVVVYETGKIDKIRKESIEIIKQLEKDGVIFVDGIENLKKLY